MNMQKTAPEDFQWQIFQEIQELEEQKTKEALELVLRKHKLIKWEGELERAARTLQRLESSSGQDSVWSPRQFLLWFVLIFPDFDTARPSFETACHSHSFLDFSHHIPLCFVAARPTVREKLSLL